jgi:hypothetical protein
MRASEEFNLSLVSFAEDDSTTGIWDGEKFVLTVPFVPYDHEHNSDLPRWAVVDFGIK